MELRRLVPGAIGTDWSRALWIGPAANPPAAWIRRRHGAARVPAVAQALPISGDLSRALAQSTFGNDPPIGVWLLTADGLATDTEYEWVCAASGSTAEHTTAFHTLPPDELRVAVASCYYDGFGGAADYARSLATLRPAPHAKILAGDNLYLDIHARVRDDALSTGALETGWVYRRHFHESAYADVLARIPTLTTWDDHEFWNNFPEEQWWLTRSKAGSRRQYVKSGFEALKLLQAALNPGFTVAHAAASRGSRELHLSFEWDTPLVSWFFADVRSQRRLYAYYREMMPEPALQALEKWASERLDDKPGVLVLGQPLVIEEGGKTDYTPPDFARQYARIWQAVRSAGHDVLIVSGDVHHSRLLEMPTQNNVIYEFVTSPAVHIPTVASTPLGGFRQGSGDVGFPKRIDVPAIGGIGAFHAAPKYLFGTEARSTLGTLAFRRGSSGVEFAPAMLDMERQNLSAARAANANDHLFSFGQSPSWSRCDGSRWISLKKRRTT